MAQDGGSVLLLWVEQYVSHIRIANVNDNEINSPISDEMHVHYYFLSNHPLHMLCNDMCRIQEAHVELILDSVLAALSQSNHCTFTYVETKYFSKWYTSLSTIQQQTLQHLIATKQFNFANGGWVMHDEATTHYMGMIDQTTLGHSFLKKVLGVVPNVGWQWDPFGHLATEARLMTGGVGFDALYFGR
jgi:hypothetical protein